MDGKICVDASFALKLVLSEADRPGASGVAKLAAGGLGDYGSRPFCIRDHFSASQSFFRKEITQGETDEAFEILAGLKITYHHPSAIQESAWVLARDIHRPTAYDAFYLALAQQEGCPFWTGDKRLYKFREAPFKVGSRGGPIS